MTAARIWLVFQGIRRPKRSSWGELGLTIVWPVIGWTALIQRLTRRPDPRYRSGFQGLVAVRSRTAEETWMVRASAESPTRC